VWAQKVATARVAHIQCAFEYCFLKIIHCSSNFMDFFFFNSKKHFRKIFREKFCCISIFHKQFGACLREFGRSRTVGLAVKGI
jgi:hypothetical protein